MVCKSSGQTSQDNPSGRSFELCARNSFLPADLPTCRPADLPTCRLFVEHSPPFVESPSFCFALPLSLPKLRQNGTQIDIFNQRGLARATSSQHVVADLVIVYRRFCTHVATGSQYGARGDQYLAHGRPLLRDEPIVPALLRAKAMAHLFGGKCGVILVDHGDSVLCQYSV